MLLVICRGQKIRAQSSAEADDYAAVKGMKEMLHVQEILGWMGEPMISSLRMNSSAGRSVFSYELQSVAFDTWK